MGRRLFTTIRIFASMTFECFEYMVSFSPDELVVCLCSVDHCAEAKPIRSLTNRWELPPITQDCANHSAGSGGAYSMNIIMFGFEGCSTHSKVTPTFKLFELTNLRHSTTHYHPDLHPGAPDVLHHWHHRWCNTSGVAGSRSGW